MNKYTVQIIVAGYALPEGNDIYHCGSLREIRILLQREHDMAESYGAAYEPSEAVIFKGRFKDVTDMYPDKTATMGPRGGVTISNC